MKNLFLGALTCAIYLTSTFALAETSVPSCTDCHVNLSLKGVMSDHLHKSGEYMLSYTTCICLAE